MQGGVGDQNPPEDEFLLVFSTALLFTKHEINSTENEENYSSNGLS